MTGHDLARARKAAGLSQTDLAKRAGLARCTVSYWEGKAQLDATSWAVERMAEVLGLRVFRTAIARASWGVRTYARQSDDLWATLAAWDETPARLHHGGRCGAKTRKGTPCRMKREPGKRRCKLHGGKSTGPRTPEGIERIRDAQRQRWARWKAERDRALRG